MSLHIPLSFTDSTWTHSSFTLAHKLELRCTAMINLTKCSRIYFCLLTNCTWLTCRKQTDPWHGCVEVNVSKCTQGRGGTPRPKAFQWRQAALVTCELWTFWTTNSRLVIRIQRSLLNSPLQVTWLNFKVQTHLGIVNCQVKLASARNAFAWSFSRMHFQHHRNLYSTHIDLYQAGQTFSWWHVCVLGQNTDFYYKWSGSWG